MSVTEIPQAGSDEEPLDPRAPEAAAPQEEAAPVEPSEPVEVAAPQEEAVPVEPSEPVAEEPAEEPATVEPAAVEEPVVAEEPAPEPPPAPTEPEPPTAPEPITPSPAAPPPVPEPPAEPVTPLDAGLAAAAETTTELAPPPVIPEETAETVEEPPARSGRTAFLLGVAVMAIPLAAALVFALRGHDDTAERRRAQALAQSRQLALNLVSIDYKTLDRDLKRISDSTTGKAREEFDEKILSNDTYKKLFAESQGVVTSTIQRVGLEPCGADDEACRRGDKAVVLVFLDQESKNKLRTTPRVDRNRVALTLVRQGDRWLVSEVKVV